MDLVELKSKICFVSPDAEDNQTLYARLQLPADCFGRGFQESSKFCSQCVVLAELEGRREPISVFCKELTDITKPVKKSPVAKPPKEVSVEPATWRLDVKKMFDEGLSKEDITAKILATYPEVKKGMVSLVYNGSFVSKKIRDAKKTAGV